MVMMMMMMMMLMMRRMMIRGDSWSWCIIRGRIWGDRHRKSVTLKAFSEIFLRV